MLKFVLHLSISKSFILLILVLLACVNVHAQLFGGETSANLSNDTITYIDAADSISQSFLKSDTLNLDSLDDGPKLVMRNYNHRQQIIVGSVVMSCIAIMLVFLNNYNPRR